MHVFGVWEDTKGQGVNTHGGEGERVNSSFRCAAKVQVISVSSLALRSPQTTRQKVFGGPGVVAGRGFCTLFTNTANACKRH